MNKLGMESQLVLEVLKDQPWLTSIKLFNEVHKRLKYRQLNKYGRRYEKSKFDAKLSYLCRVGHIVKSKDEMNDSASSESKFVYNLPAKHMSAVLFTKLSARVWQRLKDRSEGKSKHAKVDSVDDIIENFIDQAASLYEGIEIFGRIPE